MSVFEFHEPLGTPAESGLALLLHFHVVHPLQTRVAALGWYAEVASQQCAEDR